MNLASIKGGLERSANEVNAFNIPLYILIGFLILGMGLLAGMMFTYQSSAGEIGKVGVSIGGSLANAIALCVVYLKRAGQYNDLLLDVEDEPDRHEKVPKWNEFRNSSPLNNWAVLSAVLVAIPLFLLIIAFINLDIWKSWSFLINGISFACIITSIVTIIKVHLPARQ